MRATFPTRQIPFTQTAETLKGSPFHFQTHASGWPVNGSSPSFCQGLYKEPRKSGAVTRYIIDN